MSRIARIVLPGIPVHVTQRGNGRQRVFFDDGDRQLYVDLLREHAGRAGFRVWAYCLMPNHVHLVGLPERERSLADGLGRTHANYARHFNLRTRGCGHVWQARFFSCPLDARHLWRAMAYVERNPVKAGLVDRATAWLHSSAASSSTPPDWPQVTRLPNELERLRPGLLKRPLPEEFEAEFRACCAGAVPRHVRLAESAVREVRGALASMDRERRAVQGNR